MSYPILNVAATCPNTRALGPGMRAVVWVQGCAFRCPGCIAPDWIAIRPANLIDPGVLAKNLMADPRISGITISGGEPMLQADALAVLVWEARKVRPVDVICFSGYRLEQLYQAPPNPGVSALLHSIDVLVDGPYIQRLNNDQGLRGSTNQRIHYLTNRLISSELETQPRSSEIHIQNGQAMLVGVPTQGILHAFSDALDRFVAQPVGD